MVEIEPKLFSLDEGTQVLVGGRKYSRPRRPWFVSAESGDFAGFEHAQDLRLDGGSHVADLVEKQSAAMRLFELSGPRVHAGGDTGLDSKELRLEQVLWECGAVQGHKRPIWVL